MQAIFETIFDVGYLTSMTIIGILILKKSERQSVSRVFGLMLLILAFGDAFHLIPRMDGLLFSGLEANVKSLGIGKLVTSITMTVFYLLLYYIWRKRYKVQGKRVLSIVIVLLGICRMILLALPHNRWTSSNAPLVWGIYRNIPFVIMGAIVIYLFYKYAKIHEDKVFKYMYLAITLSFAFYIPVVLFAQAFPMIGMLMMPKTICYIWIAVMGYKLQAEKNLE